MGIPAYEVSMFLGANNDDPAETTDREGGSGDEAGRCDQCMSL